MEVWPGEWEAAWAGRAGPPWARPAVLLVAFPEDPEDPGDQVGHPVEHPVARPVAQRVGEAKAKKAAVVAWASGKREAAGRSSADEARSGLAWVKGRDGTALAQGACGQRMDARPGVAEVIA